MGANGIFTIDYIDTTQFGERKEVEVHFSTKMPNKIKMPEETNIFEKKDLINSTGNVNRISEDKYVKNSQEIENEVVLTGVS